MASSEKRSGDEARIRAVIDDWAKALRAKDVARLLSHHAADFVHFSLAPPLRDAADEKDLRKWFSSWRGPLGYEIRDLRITAGEDVAFCHSLNRLSGETEGGVRSELWFRHTLCFRKIGGDWKIAHEHESVPFYMDGSYRAAIDLEP
jgi:PhnB protein